MDAHGDVAIETTDLTKVFGKTRAVDGINLSVRTGSVYSLLGPNGAGKTTTIRILATLLRPDGGTAQVFAHDVVRETDAVRGRVSLTGQFASVDEDLSALENLILQGRLLGHSWARARARASELLDAFDLTRVSGRQAKNFSGGMRRRLDIAASLIVTPDLLFLDEPTTGLDPRSRYQVWEIIRTIASEGTTVLLTTQYLDEADQISDRIAVIDQGRVIAEGTSGQLKASIGAGVVHVRLLDPAQRSEAERLLSRTLGTPVQLESDPAALSARVSPGAIPSEASERVARALAELADSHVAVADFALGQPTLDEVFLTLTGRPAQPAPGDQDATNPSTLQEAVS